MFGTSGQRPLDTLELDSGKKVSTTSKKMGHGKKGAAGGRTDGRYRIPIVYMVYKRPDYLRESIETLRQSDYPFDTLPIIISHDGHVEEMVSYVESIKSEFKIIQLFHPHACAEHPSTFPGDDPKLNENYQGDTYGNKREGKITCCKHHFTWLLNTVFDMEQTADADGFLFLEEDYVVAPTIYETIQNGFTYIDDGRREKYFGLTFDPTEGYSYGLISGLSDKWMEKRFVTGPMAIRRDMFSIIRDHASDYCTYDDYNWDWSIVNLMTKRYLPFQILVPGVLQVAHIGLEGGLHENSIDFKKRQMFQQLRKSLGPFHAKVGKPYGKNMNNLGQSVKPFGGWGHPADHEHCLKLFGDAEKNRLQ
jgi:alpha-1,6-mannosyl-glycoprotein beta-1,2-N-acetylglucosaminyltransferase